MTKSNRAGASNRFLMWTIWPVLILALAVVAFLRVSLAGVDLFFLASLAIMLTAVGIVFATVVRTERRRTEAIRDLTAIVERMADERRGRIARIDDSSHRDFDPLTQALNRLIDSVNGELLQLRESADEVQSLADRLQGSTESLRALADQMLRDAAELADAVRNEKERRSADAQSMGVLAEISGEAHERATEQAASIRMLVNRLTSLREILDQIKSNLQQTCDANVHALGISNSLHGLAEEANLASLNTAVEAARGNGSSGGLSAVALEMRNLAERTNHGAGTLTGSIREIHRVVERLIDDVRHSAAIAAEDSSAETTDVDLTDRLDALARQATNIAERSSRDVERFGILDQRAAALADSIRSLSEELSSIEELHEEIAHKTGSV